MRIDPSARTWLPCSYVRASAHDWCQAECLCRARFSRPRLLPPSSSADFSDPFFGRACRSVLSVLSLIALILLVSCDPLRNLEPHLLLKPLGGHIVPYHPSVQHGVVLVVTLLDGTIVGLNPASGEVIWKDTLGRILVRSSQTLSPPSELRVEADPDAVESDQSGKSLLDLLADETLEFLPGLDGRLYCWSWTQPLSVCGERCFAPPSSCPFSLCFPGCPSCWGALLLSRYLTRPSFQL